MIPISFPAVEYLTFNMREIDAREIYGMRGHDDPLLLAKEVVLAATYGKAAIATDRGIPSGIIGVSPLWPGVWSAWSFGTDNWPKAVLQLSRFALRELRPFLLNRGVHRLQCESRIDHSDAHRWLSSMGAQREGILKGYGKDGADYVMFSWSNTNELVRGSNMFSGWRVSTAGSDGVACDDR